MTVTFFSNFMNHHQLPFCKVMYELIGEGFKFISCKPISKERLNMGYTNLNDDYSFIIRLYDGEAAIKEVEKLTCNSDVVIFGASPIKYRKMRYETNKLTFFYTERLFKKGLYRRFLPIVRKHINTLFRDYYNENMYILCASAYAACDFDYIGIRGNAFNWGYFPEIIYNDIDELMKKKESDVVTILWVARFIKLKHPEAALDVARRLNKDKIKFRMQFIGDGPEMPNSKLLCHKYGVEDKVEFLGTMSPEEVRKYMIHANIFLFTSDYEEGWGAVVNEALNSGCAIVASHAVGSVPMMIKDGINGCIYKNGDINELYEKTKELIINSSKRNMLSKNAVNSTEEYWNPQTAAQRFLNLSQSILEKRKVEYDYGPCAKAKILRNNWYR